MIHEEAVDKKENLETVFKHIQQGIIKKATYFGIPTYKFPLDAWVYQQLLFDYKPDVIVEIGSKFGGSALMMAHWLDRIGKGRIISVDICDKIYPLARQHPRCMFLTGAALDVLPQILEQIKFPEKVIVIEDSSHDEKHTLACLRLYSPLIKKGGYYIVEDSIANHGLPRNYSGPYPAIQTFLKENHAFEVDRECEQYLITWNPSGYLKRVH